MKPQENPALSGLWHNAPEELPHIEGNPEYEEAIPCLVFRHNSYEVLYYDCYYKCWNDSENDDYFCDNTEELKYIQLEN